MQAIRFDTGPARILAGPGSGKTLTIVNRVAYLINERGVKPENILVITFTKAAAGELRNRFASLMGNSLLPVNFHTFHSLFYYFLKQSHIYSEHQVLSKTEKLKIISHVKNTIKKSFPSEINVDTESLEKLISYALNTGTLKNAEEGFECLLSEAAMKAAIKEYLKCVDQIKCLDFDDFANRVNEVFNKNTRYLKRMQDKYTYILVDEFQDINQSQYSVLKRLAQNHRNIYVVGDDDQAIYGFRGSDPGIMREFLEDFPEACCILLNENYRCSREILTSAMTCIGENKDRIAKELCAGRGSLHPVGIIGCSTKEIEEKKIIEAIKAYDGPRSEIAVIARTNAVLDLYSVALKRAGIPFFYREKRKDGLFDSMVALDVMSYLRIATGTCSREDFFRVIDKGKFFIPRIYFDRSDMDCSYLVKRCQNESFEIREAAQSFCRKMDLLSKVPLSAALNYIRVGLGYDSYIAGMRLRGVREFDRAEGVFAKLEELMEEWDSLEGFLSFAKEYEAFEKEQKENDGKIRTNSKNEVNLMTMHGAKGLEYKYVILPDVNEGKIPHRHSGDETKMEEERRMFYVAMTRAKDRLDIFYVGGKDDYHNLPSRFLRKLL